MAAAFVGRDEQGVGVQGQQAFGVGRHGAAPVGEAAAVEGAAQGGADHVAAVAHGREPVERVELGHQGGMDRAERHGAPQGRTHHGALGQPVGQRASGPDEQVAPQGMALVPWVGHVDLRKAVRAHHREQRGVAQAQGVALRRAVRGAAAARGEQQGQDEQEKSRAHVIINVWFRKSPPSVRPS